MIKFGRRAVVGALALITSLTGLSVVGQSRDAYAGTPADIASIAAANLGKHYCDTNSAGGKGFETSCSGHFWCADFAKWVWRQAGADVNGLDTWAGHFVQHYGGTLQGTPHVGDAVIFNYRSADDYADHVAIVTAVNNDGTIDSIGGDEGGDSSGSDALFWTTSSVKRDHYHSAVGSTDTGQKVSGYVSPRGLSSPPPPRGVQGAGSESGPAVVTYSFGGGTDTAVFGRAGDGSVSETYFHAGSWASTSLHGQIQGEPAVLVNLDGSIDVFVWGALDGRLWEKYWTAGQGWTPDWIDLGGSLTSSPAVVQLSDRSVEVYARGNGDHLVERYYTDGGGWISSWQDLGGQLAGRPSPLANSDGSVDVFARGDVDDSLVERYWTWGGGWGSWQSLGAKLSSAPTVVQLPADNSVEVYGRGGNGDLSEMYYGSQGWSGWQDLQVPITAEPAALTNSDGSVDVFARSGQDDSLVERYWTWAGSWGPVVNLGGVLTTAPAVVQQPDHSVDVFANTSDPGGLSETYYTDGWCAVFPMGPPVN